MMKMEERSTRSLRKRSKFLCYSGSVENNLRFDFLNHILNLKMGF